ncbi:hypothetical protein BLNAU_16454 [Blattamonas nauphoetae]|uniref:Uncharacterized protein n=1 Tax=Blattamonas nauphoetae TaxID=2049346 RepID=A0ABQ9XBC6_9EUKA|nr:hypothetical protein BLNAU_16454 [Blattamonas nauphoetae]
MVGGTETAERPSVSIVLVYGSIFPRTRFTRRTSLSHCDEHRHLSVCSYPRNQDLPAHSPPFSACVVGKRISLQKRSAGVHHHLQKLQPTRVPFESPSGSIT